MAARSLGTVTWSIWSFRVWMRRNSSTSVTRYHVASWTYSSLRISHIMPLSPRFFRLVCFHFPLKICLCKTCVFFRVWFCLPSSPLLFTFWFFDARNKASLEWEMFEQVCMWKLLQAELGRKTHMIVEHILQPFLPAIDSLSSFEVGHLTCCCLVEKFKAVWAPL